MYERAQVTLYDHWCEWSLSSSHSTLLICSSDSSQLAPETQCKRTHECLFIHFSCQTHIWTLSSLIISQARVMHLHVASFPLSCSTIALDAYHQLSSNHFPAHSLSLLPISTTQHELCANYFSLPVRLVSPLSLLCHFHCVSIFFERRESPAHTVPSCSPLSFHNIVFRFSLVSHCHVAF